MPKVSIHAQAPNFTLLNYLGEPVSLADFQGKSNVLLVFNRTFS